MFLTDLGLVISFSILSVIVVCGYPVAIVLHNHRSDGVSCGIVLEGLTLSLAFPVINLGGSALFSLAFPSFLRPFHSLSSDPFVPDFCTFSPAALVNASRLMSEEGEMVSEMDTDLLKQSSGQLIG